MIVDKELNKFYRSLPRDYRKVIRNLHVSFRDYIHTVAAKNISQGYFLGVMAGLGDTEQDKKLYERRIANVVPPYVLPHLEELFLNNGLPELVAEMQEGMRRSYDELRHWRRARR